MNSRIAPFDTLSLRAGRLQPAPDSDAIDLRALMRTFWKKRLHILAAMLGSGLIVLLLVSLVSPTYTAFSKVMLDPRKAQIITNAEVLSDLNASEQVVNGEIAVLRSNLLIQRVIASLDPQLVERLDPALQPLPLGSRVKGWINAALGRGKPAQGGNAPALTPEEQRIERLVNAIRARLKIYNEPNSYVMVIRVESDNAVMAMRVANAFANSYITWQLDNRRAAVGQATEWLETRLGTLKAEVEAAEAAVAAYQAESLVANGGTLDAASQQLANLNGQLIDARAARVEAQARLEQLRALVEEQGLEAAAQIVDTPASQMLREQALDLRQKDAVWARSYSADQERRVEIATKLDEIAAAMDAEVSNVLAVRRSELEIAQIREDGLTASIGDLENRVMQISQSRLGLRQLEREAAAARVNYESLLTRVTEARTQRQLQQADVKLVERASVPKRPSAPKTKMLVLLGAVLGATGMIVFVFLSEMTAVTFRTAREVEAETGLSVLSALPLKKWQDTAEALAEIRANPYGQYAERIRQLRTALLMGNGRDNRQSVMLLSSGPGEGKTTAALALAQMAVLAGRSTVVVDCDLRRARVAPALGVEMTTDFGDFIEGSASLPEVIYAAPDHGFDVIAARSPRPSAADELSTQWLAPLMEELTRVYEFVVVDAPAMLAVSDALIVAEVVETRIYLVAANATPRAVVRDGLSRLQEMGLGVAGMVLNKVDARSSPDPYAEGYGYDA